MRIRLLMAAMLVAVCFVGTAAGQDVTFDIEDKVITPATGGFTLAITATNHTAAPIGIASVTTDVLFSPSMAGNINFASISTPATPTWSTGTNPGPDTMLGTSMRITTSSNDNYMLAVGETTFIVLSLELKQPNPDLVKYSISLDGFEAGDQNGDVLNTATTSGFIAVPEPGSVAVLAAGALGLLRRRRRA